ncbi:hypothetical protein BAUCODRAFT_149297 [Baudoinia panamericana UAMH 10762]|uniref:Uncharacterized protein n=1 Tax=Baudoinia panamericana (strain UAMH 10762) TaxID=717646 RepID=M2MF82_BAUPA|nr:uncharacterized protein BAUCODRAFT_149297 [Baudoinia panamericana UAMH 10762]EMC95296.1 hypothetical protein BAUCODRAFT_149297 [Baudoinia panamericana UAMH 10762]
MQSFFTITTLAAGLFASSVSAGSNHGHNHNLHEKRHGHEHELMARQFATGDINATCGCTTYTTTWYGEPTLVQMATATVNTTVTIKVSPVAATGPLKLGDGSSALVVAFGWLLQLLARVKQLLDLQLLARVKQLLDLQLLARVKQLIKLQQQLSAA